MSLAPPLATYLQGYLAWLRFEKRYSELTAQSYARDLHYLFDLLGDNSLSSLTSQHIRRFVASLHGKGLGGRSLARLLSAWRGFFNYLIRDCGYTANPCIGIRAPKLDKALPQALSVEQAVHLMEVSHNTLAAIRDQAMLELLYSSGLRLAEMVNLEAAYLSAALASGEITVTGKGNKQRVVPLGKFAIAALQTWLTVREQLALPDETALFVGARGQRIAHRVVQLRLKQWGITQGITSNVHPHLLRHSFATHVLQSSGDLRAVQEMLGHASISSTQIYTHLDFQYLSKIYDTTHPRAKLKP
ncbi:MAG: tyrosine recombinase XerC [Pseudomonadota bacterium]|jgi:integrase/recombinase XerC